MKRKKERAKGSVVHTGPREEPLPIGSVFTHTIDNMEFKVEVVASDKCKGCVALEGLRSECAKLHVKAGHCFSTERPDGKEVSFRVLKQSRGRGYKRVSTDEEDDE